MYQIIALHIPLRLFVTGSGIGTDGATALAEALRVNASLTTLGVTGGSYAFEGTTMPVEALMCKVRHLAAALLCTCGCLRLALAGGWSGREVVREKLRRG